MLRKGFFGVPVGVSAITQSAPPENHLLGFKVSWSSRDLEQLGDSKYASPFLPIFNLLPYIDEISYQKTAFISEDVPGGTGWRRGIESRHWVFWRSRGLRLWRGENTQDIQSKITTRSYLSINVPTSQNRP